MKLGVDGGNWMVRCWNLVMMAELDAEMKSYNSIHVS